MRIISTVIIERPVAVVWDYFHDTDNMSRWLTGFREFQPISGTPGEVGAKARHIYDNRGKTMELIEEITEKVPRQRFVGILSHPSMTSRMENTFTDLGAGRTKLVSITETKFKGLIRFLAPLLKRGFQRRQNGDLNRLRTLIESET